MYLSLMELCLWCHGWTDPVEVSGRYPGWACILSKLTVKQRCWTDWLERRLKACIPKTDKSWLIALASFPILIMWLKPILKGSSVEVGEKFRNHSRLKGLALTLEKVLLGLWSWACRLCCGQYLLFVCCCVWSKMDNEISVSMGAKKRPGKFCLLGIGLGRRMTTVHDSSWLS